MTLYVTMIIIFGLLMYGIAHKGALQYSSGEAISSGSDIQNLSEGFRLFSFLTFEHIQSTIGILLLQIIIILLICRCVGLLFKKIGQPTVIGEIMAGILLGPSVLGYFFPQASAMLFPEASLVYLNMLSQFGLILFMFTIGMELDLSVVRKRIQDTVFISHASTIVPFFIGMLMAYYIYEDFSFKETPFLSFALFIGISLSITAFPVLARIIQERSMTRTHLGSLSLAIAANCDITAWCMLAAVVAYAQAGTLHSAIYNVLFSMVFIVIMVLLVRPILRVIGDLYHNTEVVSKPLVAVMFLILLLSSYITEILGLHVLFGAFFAGMVMPENFRFRKIMNEKIEDVSLTLFLPLFFVCTGLQTHIGLIQGKEMWLLCGAFILAAIIGKFGGTFVAARFSKESLKDSLYMGAFMNTRGLMELVVLTIGLEMKILPPVIFVMLVLMTLVTTFMTTPLISFINGCYRASERIMYRREEKLKTDTFKLLLSFGRKGNAPVMLNLAHQMFSKGEKKLDVTALHLTVGSDVNPGDTSEFESTNFEPVINEAGKLNMQLRTRYDVCCNAVQHICSIVNDENYDFLLVGAGVSMSALETDVQAVSGWKKVEKLFFGKNQPPAIFSPGALLRDKTKEFVSHCRCSVGIFVNRGFARANNILVIINDENDLQLLAYVNILRKTTNGFIQLLNLGDKVSANDLNEARPGTSRKDLSTDTGTIVADTLKDYVIVSKDTAIPPEQDLTMDLLRSADLMIVGYHTWLIISNVYHDMLQGMPSTFIIQHK